MKNISIGKKWQPPEGCGIYKLRFLGIDKIYIGSSINLKSRYSQHKGVFKGCIAFKDEEWRNSYKLYKNFIMEVLEYCKREELNNKEQHYIDISPKDKLLNSQFTVYRKD